MWVSPRPTAGRRGLSGAARRTRQAASPSMHRVHSLLVRPWTERHGHAVVPAPAEGPRQRPTRRRPRPRGGACAPVNCWHPRVLADEEIHGKPTVVISRGCAAARGRNIPASRAASDAAPGTRHADRRTRRPDTGSGGDAGPGRRSGPVPRAAGDGEAALASAGLGLGDRSGEHGATVQFPSRALTPVADSAAMTPVKPPQRTQLIFLCRC